MISGINMLQIIIVIHALPVGGMLGDVDRGVISVLFIFGTEITFPRVS